MAGKTIKIDTRVTGCETLPWEDLKSYEANGLKAGDERDVSKLKNAIVNSKFSFPFFLWAGHRYILDGAGRLMALMELERAGYQIPDMPVVNIEADSLNEAKKLVLQASSEHGIITQESFAEFADGIDVFAIADEINIKDVDMSFDEDMVNIDDDKTPEAKKERYDEAQTRQIVLYFQGIAYDNAVDNLDFIKEEEELESFSEVVELLIQMYIGAGKDAKKDAKSRKDISEAASKRLEK